MSKVLIVEDDPTNRLVFTRILSKAGNFEVHCTDDVDEVLDTVQSGTIDIVLMDIGLPNSIYKGQPINGVDITRIIKADPNTCHVPIILVTAFTMPGDRERFLKTSGADGYIPKPIVDHQAFVHEITHFMRKPKPEPPVSESRDSTPQG
jgi:CheY-like chemotaxis protein